MRLDPRIPEIEIRRILVRQAAEAFGPVRAKDLAAALERTAAALALIARQPLERTGEAPDLSGIEESAWAGTCQTLTPSEPSRGEAERPSVTAPHDLTAAEIVRRVRAGELKAVDLVTTLLDRITRLEPRLQAWATLDADGALAAAAERDRAAAQGQIGALHGVPVGVKDIIDVAGLPTIAGFEPFRERVATRDADVVARLRAAGAIVLGKTHTTQFAHGDPAPTQNPWDPERTPGGSSAGSGAGVAARMLPVALGTQTAGSVLRPAAYCGVVAFKPTFNWVGRAGVIPLAWSLDHVGLFTRTVEDVALVYGAITGGPTEVAEMARPPRLAVLTDFLGRAQPDVRAHMVEVVERLRAAGAEVAERTLPVELELVFAVHHIIMESEVAGVHAAGLAVDREHYSPNIRQAIEAGQLTPATYRLQATRLRRRIARSVDAALAEVDALLLPTASNVAPDRRSTGDRAFQAPWTLLGTPAVTLPTGLNAEGLPLASQLAGRRGSDGDLLTAAVWCERTLGTILPPEIVS